ncbi:hypothetical protein T440DRAFT_406696, partial [Plenodomus tracheiphilus IPT5]
MWKPCGTLPANSTAPWRAEPTERGTWSILTTCVFTLIACVYTSIHLNIPQHKRSGWKVQLPRKMWWMLVAFAAPELAQIDRTLIQEDTHGAKPMEKQLKVNDWTKTHSHFAIMGGFAFDTTKRHRNFLPHSHTRLTITPNGLLRFAQYAPNLIPDISADTIRDKNKTDSVAKTLLSLQVSWFMAQTIGRMVVRQPISVLEVNTFLHAMCFMIIYMAWWHKPFNVEEP